MLPRQSKVSMKARLGLLLTTILSCFILYSCMSQEQQEQVLQNSEPQSVDVTVNVGGDSRAERFLGTFDQISRLSLDIDRNYGNKRVLTDFPLEHDGSKWTGTINKLIVGFDYTITGHAYKCTCLLYTSPSPRDGLLSRMPSSA